MLTGFDEVCGKTKGRRDQRYTWWWNKDVKEVIVRKKDAHKEILRRTSQVQEHEELAKKVFTKAMKKVAERKLRELSEHANKVFKLVKSMK